MTIDKITLDYYHKTASLENPIQESNGRAMNHGTNPLKRGPIFLILREISS
jgi:hypothetical protein